jgi:hypothetical protein
VELKPEELAGYLNSLTAEQRQVFFAALFAVAQFCDECYWPYYGGKKGCSCDYPPYED